MNKLKQLFCKHIYKVVSEEVLSVGRYIHKYRYTLDGLKAIDCYTILQRKVCVKCGKEYLSTVEYDKTTDVDFDYRKHTDDLIDALKRL